MSHEVTLPEELESFATRMHLALPTVSERQMIVRRIAQEWSKVNPGRAAVIEPDALADGDGDSGTSRRVLGTFLTWLAEQRARIFVVATANDISALPPPDSPARSWNRPLLPRSTAPAPVVPRSPRLPSRRSCRQRTVPAE
ncbi:MAG: ATPase central domain protein [Gammaproteobacteria bacterium]|nr:ATPase central domain protein [Gammaproteobacteria bacterium]